jgi:Ca2+-binding RTX toxin-like protein
VLSGGNAASVTLGTGTSQLAFIGPSALSLTGGAGSATVTADAGTNTFTAGSGSLDVTGGGGKDSYVFHANSEQLTIEDFSAAKGDKLVIDSAMKGSMVQASDYQGGTLITFGSGGASHAIDVHGLAAVPASAISWA